MAKGAFADASLLGLFFHHWNQNHKSSCPNLVLRPNGIWSDSKNFSNPAWRTASQSGCLAACFSFKRNSPKKLLLSFLHDGQIASLRCNVAPVRDLLGNCKNPAPRSGTVTALIVADVAACTQFLDVALTFIMPKSNVSIFSLAPQ